MENQSIENIQLKVKETIIEVMEMEGTNPEDIGITDSFFGDEETPGLIEDSLAILEISSALSEEFDVDPSFFNEDSFQNVETLSNMIAENMHKEIVEA